MSKFPYDPLNHCVYLRDGQFDGPNGLPQIMAAFRASGDKTLVVHFHGGLVDRAAGQKAADELFALSYSESAFPVFFIWESGLREMLRQTLPEIVKNTLFQVLLEQISRFAVGKIEQVERAGALGGVARGPVGPLVPRELLEVKRELRDAQRAATPAFNGKNPDVLAPTDGLTKEEEAAFTKALTDDGRFVDEATAITTSLAPPRLATALRGGAAPIESNTPQLLAPDLKQELERQLAPVSATDSAARAGISLSVLLTLAGRGLKILKNVVARFANKTHHGVQATIIEEILRDVFLGKAGRMIWKEMKDDTLDAFGSDAARFGGTAFLQELKKLEASGAAPQQIVLVGHSTGAVYICHFLKAASAQVPGMKFRVIFLAPACDFALLRDTLQNYGAQIENLRVFGMQDSVETAEFLLEIDELKSLPLLQKLYPGSLLYFVSGVLEDKPDWPLVGMERYYSGAAPYDTPEVLAVRQRLTATPNSFVWSVAGGGNGLSSGSKKHGDFDNDPATLQSLAHLLKNGF